MKFYKKLLTHNCLIVTFSSIFFYFALNNFINHEPRHDQAFHITWLQNLMFSDHFLPENFFQNFRSLLTDEKGFVYELFKPANNPGDYHAYLFQINSVLTVYFFSFILKLSSIQIYNLVSILFASLSIIINYQILLYYLKKNKILDENFKNIVVAQTLYCSLSIVFYKYYFSPLGHHNIAYFVFSVVIFIFLKANDKEISFKYIKFGCLLGFAVYFQITIGLLLLPLFSFCIIFQKNKITINNIINFCKFILSFCIVLAPFIVLMINDFININEGFFTVLLGSEGSEFSYYLNKIFFWFTGLYSLSTPIIFISFLFSFIITYKIKKFNLIQLIILTHFIINIILSIFYISYLRNFYYIINLIIILSSFTFIYIYFKKKFFNKLLIISFIILSILYNLNIILHKEKLALKENLFYKIYFKEQGNITKKLNKIKKITSNNKIIFLSDYSKNYLSAFDIFYYQDKILINKPLVNLSNRINNNSKYSKMILGKYKINENFILISLAENFDYPKKIFIDLKNEKIINQNCNINENHLFNEIIFHDTSSGIFKVRLFATNIDC